MHRNSKASPIPKDLLDETSRITEVIEQFDSAWHLNNVGAIWNTVGRGVQQSSVTLVIFSCLATVPAREELVLDFWRTMFFNGSEEKHLNSNVRKVVRLAEAIRSRWISVDVLPILVDTEPRRTWGWRTSQEELTMMCQLMIDDMRDSKRLPENWKPRLWSDIERFSGFSAPSCEKLSFEDCLELVKKSGERQARVREQELHLKKFSNIYHFPLGLRETAIRQVAAYTFEGVVLQKTFESPILLQSERPWREKDLLYQGALRSDDQLAIIHPFSS